MADRFWLDARRLIDDKRDKLAIWTAPQRDIVADITFTAKFQTVGDMEAYYIACNTMFDSLYTVLSLDDWAHYRESGVLNGWYL